MKRVNILLKFVCHSQQAVSWRYRIRHVMQNLVQSSHKCVSTQFPRAEHSPLHTFCGCYNRSNTGYSYTVSGHKYPGGPSRRCLPVSYLCAQTGSHRTNITRCYSSGTPDRDGEDKFHPPKPELDWDYLCDPNNRDQIMQNCINRKGLGNIDHLQGMWKMYQAELEKGSNTSELEDKLMAAAAEIPNRTHPDAPVGDESSTKLVELCGTQQVFSFPPRGVVELGEELDGLRLSNVGHTTGHRSYYFKNGFAQLEQALIQFTVDKLLCKGFTMMSVPDLIHPDIIEGCGFKTTGERTQVYRLEPRVHGDVCLAGTGEMPLAAFYMNQVFHSEELPQRAMALSRCFRAETSTMGEETGIYRVHQFNKVEMFGVTTPSLSEELFEELINIQRDLFSDLGLHFRILDMPSQDLGAPAYRKYDMEAWMPARQFWGEISSTSNCTDFQSRRLGIQYTEGDNEISKHCHTVNGTACALPRMIMAIVETYQLQDGSVAVPQALQQYMGDAQVITRPDHEAEMKWIKFTRAYKKHTKKDA